jgi:hypothetical protein
VPFCIHLICGVHHRDKSVVLLAALHTKRSVKVLSTCSLQDNDAAVWIADLLRHKTDFTRIRFLRCCFPFSQMLPLLRGQPSLKALAFCNCHIGDNILLFSDTEFTQLFAEIVLLPSSTTATATTTTTTALKELALLFCSVTMDNRPLMAAFHKNTTIVEFKIENHDDDEIHHFLSPIAVRNKHLVHLNAMLGTSFDDSNSL